MEPYDLDGVINWANGMGYEDVVTILMFIRALKEKQS
jgi:hypothetical protein